MAETKKRKAGRKGKFHDWLTPVGLTTIEGWARNGLSDEQIAHNIGIRASTLYEWKNRFPEFSEALKKGKEVVDLEVENAMLRRALGYEFDEVTQGPLDTPEGIKHDEVKRVTKHVPGDVTAQIFWLKNRVPERWRDKQNIEHSGHTTASLNLANLSEEELKRLANLDAGSDS